VSIPTFSTPVTTRFRQGGTTDAGAWEGTPGKIALSPAVGPTRPQFQSVARSPMLMAGASSSRGRRRDSHGKTPPTQGSAGQAAMAAAPQWSRRAVMAMHANGRRRAPPGTRITTLHHPDTTPPVSAGTEIRPCIPTYRRPRRPYARAAVLIASKKGNAALMQPAGARAPSRSMSTGHHATCVQGAGVPHGRPMVAVRHVSGRTCPRQFA